MTPPTREPGETLIEATNRYLRDKYPAQLSEKNKLLYYMEATELFAQDAKELERQLAAANARLERSISLEGGKYLFYLDGFTLKCKRYDEDWREFLGDKAVSALFEYALSLGKPEREGEQSGVKEESGNFNKTYDQNARRRGQYDEG